MKNKRLAISIVIFFLPAFLLMSCIFDPVMSINEKDSDSKPFYFDSLSVEEIKDLVLGNWEWTHSIIMSRNLHPPDNIMTPEGVGYTKQRYFEEDDTVSIYINNQIIETHRYEIKRFKVLPADKGYVKEIYIDEDPFQLFLSHPDTMMIGNGWLDGTDDYFVRKK